jgi:chromosome segregation protein
LEISSLKNYNSSAINEKIQEIFPRLFEGGTTQLVLTDPNKPLETGVEFIL